MIQTDKQGFFDKFSLTRFRKRSFVSKLVMPVFGQGKCVRVYGRQGKLDKCIRNTSRKTCQGKLVKENLSRKTCQGKLVKENLSRKTCQGKLVKEYFYGFDKQKATLAWDKCLTTFLAHKQQNLSRKNCWPYVYTRESKLVKGNLSRKTCSSVRGI
jgi:hypothetical protein